MTLQKGAVKMRSKRIPKLSFKTAKAIAIQEFGTAKGLIPCECNNEEYQRYEIKMGNHAISISNDSYNHWGIACIRFCGEATYIDMETLEENYKITDSERDKARKELISDAVSCNGKFVFRALLEEYGLETCHRMLDEVAKFKV
jgi:hypothetical protein